MEPEDGQHALMTQHVSVHPTPERPTVREGGAIINSYHSLAPDFLRVIHHHIAVCDIDSGRGVDPACRQAAGAAQGVCRGIGRSGIQRAGLAATEPGCCTLRLLAASAAPSAQQQDSMGSPHHPTTLHHTTPHHTQTQTHARAD